MGNRYQFITVDQPIGRFYVIKIKASELIEISESNERTESDKTNEKREPYNSTGVQRKKDQKRINEIAKYCNTSSPMFPTPIILSGKSNYFNFDVLSSDEDVDYSNLESGIMNIDMDGIKRNKEYLSIVDGQHRLAGISLSGRAEEFDLLAMLIFDTESYQDAEIFSVINRNQKQVSKSHVYDLYGLSDQMTVEKFSHEIVKELNTCPLSELKGRVKMLGYKKDTLEKDNKTKKNIVQYISQGTLVDCLLPLISKNYLRDNKNIEEGDILEDNDYLVLRKYLVDDDLNLAKIHVISFFNAWIKVLSKYFNNESILYKTVGFIAGFRTFKILYENNYFNHFLSYDKEIEYSFDIEEDVIERYQSIYYRDLLNLNFESLDSMKISSSLSGANYILKNIFSVGYDEMDDFLNNYIFNELSIRSTRSEKFNNLMKKYEDAKSSYSNEPSENNYEVLVTAFSNLRLFCMNSVYARKIEKKYI